MIRNVLILLLLSALAAGGARAAVGATPADSGFGLGLVLGEPTGLSAKGWLSPTSAVDFAAAWSFSGEEALDLHLDYLWHDFRRLDVDVEEGRFAIVYGLGARVKLEEEDPRIGLRIPLGLVYLVEDAPLDLFVKLAPTLNLAPDTDVDLGAGLGLRFFFR